MPKRKTLPVAIAILNANELLRPLLVVFVESLGDHKVVLAVADLKEYITRCAGKTPAPIVLVDLGQPETQGEEALRWIRAHQPGARPIALSPYDDETHILHAQHAGACGYLDRHCGPEVLRTAMAHVLATGHFETDSTHACLLEHPDGLSQQEHNRARLEKQVKGRRLQVLRLLCTMEDPTNRRIARYMRIGIRTVEGYLHELFELFGVARRSELALAAVRVGLVQV